MRIYKVQRSFKWLGKLYPRGEFLEVPEAPNSITAQMVKERLRWGNLREILKGETKPAKKPIDLTQKKSTILNRLRENKKK